MKVCGIICEYNPFHNGHAYHIQCIRAKTSCDYIVCVMSGFFTQRGEAALLSKWDRAQMALSSGADAVFELPALYAVRDAQRFALGGVSLLHSLGLVTHLGFGSEEGSLETLTQQAFAKENIFQLHEGLRRGETVARARGNAVSLPFTPNDILGVEYLRALQVLQSPIEPVVIKRHGSGYHDHEIHSFASATAIRHSLATGGVFETAMPPSAYKILQDCLTMGAAQSPSLLDTALLYALRSLSAQQLAETADISEGLENRIIRAGFSCISREECIHYIKTKRYTYARISRILTQALLGITKSMTMRYPLPSYARLLGFRRTARPFLAALGKASSIPVVVKAASFQKQGNACFALDNRAADIWALGAENSRLRIGGTNFTQHIRIQ